MNRRIFILCCLPFIAALGWAVYHGWFREQDRERPVFESYEEAGAWVGYNFDPVSSTPAKGKIRLMEYFAEGQFLKIYFKSNPEKGYLYQNVDEDFWVEFSTSSDHEAFYDDRIKGQETYRFQLE